MSDELKNTYPECKKLYRDIIFGFSEKRLRSSKKKVYIKHLNEIDNGESGKKYDDHFFLAQKKGVKIRERCFKVYYRARPVVWREGKQTKRKSRKVKNPKIYQAKAYNKEPSVV